MCLHGGMIPGNHHAGNHPATSQQICCTWHGQVIYLVLFVKDCIVKESQNRDAVISAAAVVQIVQCIDVMVVILSN